MRLIDGWLKLLAPLLFGAKLQNFRRVHPARTCRASSRIDDQSLARAPRAGVPATAALARLHDDAHRSPRPAAARGQRARALRQEHRAPRACSSARSARGETHISGLSHGEDNVSTATLPSRDGRRHRRGATGRSSSSRAWGWTGFGAPGADARLRQLGDDDAPALRRARRAALPRDARRRRDALAAADDARRRRRCARAAPRSTDGRTRRARARSSRRSSSARSPRAACSRRLEYESPVASAQVKSAILLSGLYADGATLLQGADGLARPHRAHARRARRAHSHGRARSSSSNPAGGTAACPASTSTIPGDLSAAAFLLVAAQIVAGLARDRARRRRRTRRAPGCSRSRATWAPGSRSSRRESAAASPWRELHAWSAPLRAVAPSAARSCRAPSTRSRSPARWPRARAGTTRIRDAEELRREESDRIATMARVLRAFGVGCEERPDGLDDRGTRRAPRAGRRRQPRATTGSR